MVSIMRSTLDPLLVPDSRSLRMMSLPTSRELVLKNKVAFGTGDHWRASTLRANQGLVAFQEIKLYIIQVETLQDADGSVLSLK
ncbi:hypothetical protein RJ641_019121 [Dillenia turbinata]|uniref:Uncharacterized protein n=1 Tax=Dillenia turbinata TaxID=194707 RepID=A0AAN8YXW1_9MAGN